MYMRQIRRDRLIYNLNRRVFNSGLRSQSPRDVRYTFALLNSGDSGTRGVRVWRLRNLALLQPADGWNTLNSLMLLLYLNCWVWFACSTLSQLQKIKLIDKKSVYARGKRATVSAARERITPERWLGLWKGGVEMIKINLMIQRFWQGFWFFKF